MTSKLSLSSKHILLIVMTILIALFLCLDIPARQRFATVNNEVEKIRHHVLEPAGAIERIAGEYLPYLRGDGFFNSIGCFPDVHCPTISRTWFVPIEPGKERDFIETSLKDEGYITKTGDEYACSSIASGGSCIVWGTKDTLSLRLEIKYLGSVPQPNEDIASKQWRLVTASADYEWEK